MKTGPCNRDDEPNNNLQCTQTKERLTALGPIHSHYHAGIDVDTVCKLFLQKHPHRMEAASLLFESLILCMYNEHVTLGYCFILMGFMFSIKLFILARCHDWITALEHTTLKCRKFNGNFFPRNVTPLFKTLHTGLYRQQNSMYRCDSYTYMTYQKYIRHLSFTKESWASSQHWEPDRWGSPRSEDQ